MRKNWLATSGNAAVFYKKTVLYLHGKKTAKALRRHLPAQGF